MNLLIQIQKDFLHYYQSRGKAELHSFVITFWGAFVSIFMMVGINDLDALFNSLMKGQIEHEVIFALGSAAMRSLIGGVLFALFPDQFKDRVFKKRT